MKDLFYRCVFSFLLFWMVIRSTAAAAAQDFYTGTTIRLIVGHHARRWIRRVFPNAGAPHGEAYSRQSDLRGREYARRRFSDRNKLSVQAGQAGRSDFGNWIGSLVLHQVT
jgi:hypothetical protein